MPDVGREQTGDAVTLSGTEAAAPIEARLPEAHRWSRTGRSEGATHARGASVSRKRTRPTPLLFYGYSEDVIAAWCGVNRSTAYLWKIGVRKPSAQALRLFELHRDGRVFGDEWERGWLVRRDTLVDPDGNVTTQGQLRAYWFIVQLARELARDADRLEDYHAILRRA
jgi:hypothetical protein